MSIVEEIEAFGAQKARRRLTPAYENEIGRYRHDLQAPLRKLAQASQAHADLLTSFPAAAISLVTQRLRAEARADALKLVRNGRPLQEISAALRLPFWMKRLPPEALFTDLPANLSTNDAAFGRQIRNAMPATFRPGSTWLPQVLAARDACADGFALWWAYRAREAYRTDMIGPIAAFAWHSARPDLAASQYIRRRWSARSHLASMAYEAHAWYVRMILDMQALEASIDPQRLTAGRQRGYEFVQLDTAAALEEEGRLMGHCVGDYVERAAIGYSRLFGIRSGGARVATLEIRFKGGAALGIEQISGPRNRPPEPDVLRAAHAWARCLMTFPGCAELYGPPPVNAAGWKRLWAPYVEAKAAEGVTITPPPACAGAVLDRTRELMGATLQG